MTADTENAAGCLYVRMLGEPSMEYEGRAVLPGISRSSRVFHLLQILLYEGGKGIPREQLLLRLFGEEGNRKKGDRSNNLRVTVHRLRKLLGASGLPGDHFICVKEGRYRFAGSFPVEVDARVFAGLLQRAEGLRGQKRVELLKRACGMYRGYFLPPLAGEEWAAAEEAYYQRLYTKAMEELCGFLKEQKEYPELFRWCSRAASLYPYDEWQIWQADCLAALGRMDEALALCRETAKMYLDEPGMKMSEHMLQSFRGMGKRARTKGEDLRGILESFREKGTKAGAYCCSYPGFVDVCRIAARMAARPGYSAYMLLCTVADERKRHPAASGELPEAAERLGESIREALGREDAFVRYGRRQFLALLSGASEAECRAGIGRIDAGFRRRERSRKVGVTYRMMRISGQDFVG